MTLPAPNLDDRRFQDLVDDAKRLVQQRCPEWTDHNVSDPGVTLIEVFAWMVDQLLYRLNRVPDRNYVKFLELIGVRLFPPTAARADVTFWLSAPQPDVVRVPAGTEVATVRSAPEEPVSFNTVSDLDVRPCSLSQVASSIQEGVVRFHSEPLQLEQGFYCFDEVPKPGDTLLIGLSGPVPRCAVALRFDCRIEGVGVDPRNPPLMWEAWDGNGWARCEVDHDETGGLNRAGDVVLHVPPSHQASVISNVRAGWIRTRVVEAVEGQPRYSASPRIDRLAAFTVGGTAEALHATEVREEIVGFSEGVPGQRFLLKRRPVVPGDRARLLEVASADGWEEWTEVADFAESEPEDRHFVVDAVEGAIVLGPAVRRPDGSLLGHGAVPPKGAALRIAAYRTGGGQRGNVARQALRVLKSSIPYVARVENRHAARGGVDGEDIENAKLRGPIALRTGHRAVTAEDYEHLARQAAPAVARVRCVPAPSGEGSGAVYVLIVPDAPDESGRLRFEQLEPSAEVVEAITRYLDERRMIGARIGVRPPRYQGLTVVARVRARSNADPARLQRDSLEALYRYFHPIAGGPDGRGWPFGRPVLLGEVFSVLQGVRGTELVEDARLFPADPVSGERGKSVQRIDVEPDAIVFSYGHQVRVEQG